MARVLFVVPPLTGHVNPTVALGGELARRGHTVAWMGHPDVVRPLLEPGAELVALGQLVEDGRLEATIERARRTRGLAALKVLFEDVIFPLARAMRPEVEARAASWRPDLLVVDQQALAGALAARRLGLRWVTSATTSADPMPHLAALPRVQAWILDEMRRLQVEAGLAPIDRPDRSPELVLVFSTEALAGPAEHLGPTARFVGPSIPERRPDAPDFPWRDLGPHPRVLVTLGTVNAERGGRFFRAAVEALVAEGASGVIVAPPDLLPKPPPGILVQPRVPQLALLPEVDAVVTHGGHNTVCEALWHGLPLVVAPIRDDQPVVAGQVTAAGAGVRVPFGRVEVDGLRQAIHAVLAEPALRVAARRIATSFRAAGGARTAADLVEMLLRRPGGPP